VWIVGTLFIHSKTTAMKKQNTFMMALVLLLATVITSVSACKKNEDSAITPASSSTQPVSTTVSPVSNGSTNTLATAKTATCAQPFLNGYFSGYGYHKYPSDFLNASCLANGATITLSVNCVEVPNRFTVYDGNGNWVAGTGWIGYANYYGPWGASVNGPVSMTLTFTKTTSTYRLDVETSTASQNDAWEASFGCTCPAIDPPRCDCGISHSGYYSGFGYYTYPDKELIYDCSVSYLTIYCNSVEVPNLFDVYNENGQLVATTGWIGWSSTSGPWGSSLNGPTTKTIRFPRNTRKYYLRVRTVTGSQNDAWEASVSCEYSGG
jgi:hypothetical protein